MKMAAALLLGTRTDSELNVFQWATGNWQWRQNGAFVVAYALLLYARKYIWYSLMRDCHTIRPKPTIWIFRFFCTARQFQQKSTKPTAGETAIYSKPYLGERTISKCPLNYRARARAFWPRAKPFRPSVNCRRAISSRFVCVCVPDKPHTLWLGTFDCSVGRLATLFFSRYYYK